MLFLAGSYALVYGLFFHRVAFDETKQRDVMIAVPTLGDGGESPPSAPGGDAAAAPSEKTPPTENGRPSDDVDPFRSPPAGDGHAANSENPFDGPPGVPSVPGFRFKKIKEDYTVVTLDSEWAIVRDVTVGGVMLLPNGHLKRTYSGKPPALCPT
jgi:hypothetical protein